MVKEANFDLETYRLKEADQQHPPIKERLVRLKPSKKTDAWFIQGPLPGPWLEKAAKLSGRTLNVALAILYVYGLQPSASSVLMERFHFNRLGVDKDATRRGLVQLQNAGLITYVKDGHKFKVTMLK